MLPTACFYWEIHIDFLPNREVLVCVCVFILGRFKEGILVSAFFLCVKLLIQLRDGTEC